ncbi:uncharacterized protein J7T54_003040 [Emericellopsis cladophorae]|uniref:Uncharacterized protein n=1 Tax=Emericellopsis cladophorae TaxID=2686198 RepID=A0A9Q0BCY4_9HYPO|nr:uncharacterized protein J7T54_003040 [Emericellopsis cladophorae]KAI6780261.1 hypothetical protein J7T54_003040 [Emericellopsis cladophorae]
MSPASALSLLGKRLGEAPGDKAAALKLVALLDYIPLAISQVGALIATTKRITLEICLEKLSGSCWKDITKLLSREFTELGRDVWQSNAVLETLKESFRNIQLERPGVIRLMSLICLIPSENIPKYLLKPPYAIDLDEVDDVAPVLDHDGQLEDDLDVLRRYRLISDAEGADAIGISRLVRLALHNWLVEAKYDQHQRKSIAMMETEHPSKDDSTLEASGVMAGIEKSHFDTKTSQPGDTNIASEPCGRDVPSGGNLQSQQVLATVKRGFISGSR